MDKVAQSRIRDTDIIVRWGGEEFVTLIEDIDLEQAKEKAEDIRSSIEKAIKRADDNLYKSKMDGKNRVTA